MKALYIPQLSTPTSYKLPFCHFSSPPSLKSPSFLQLSHQTPSTSGKASVRIKASSMAASNDDVQSTKPFSVLFVCLGNICRSPAAEGVFRQLVKKQGLDSNFLIEPSITMRGIKLRAASKKRGIEITSISRPIKPSDFRDFDLILAMDKQNREDILGAFERWRLPVDAHEKVRLMCSYCKKHDETQVPDPYYGGPQGFEKVLDLLEDACASLLESIMEKKI